ncbi:MAG: hypothetical protein R3C10_27450 [Pirellulales bacterium]
MRRLLQFSLRTLFVLMVLAAVLCGTIGVRMVYVRDQRAVARRLESVDSHVLNVTSTGPPTTTITWEESSQLGMAPNVLVRSLLGEEFFSNVVEISLRYKQRLTDDDLEMISRLDHLRRLDLSLTPIGDEAMRHLGELPRLESLDLGGTEVSDAGIVYLDAPRR